MSEKDTLFSIVTVCRNSEADIRPTVESVLAQTYPHIEYLIIDGASTDGTVAAAQGYREAFEKRGYTFRVQSEPDRGIYDAMNKGIRLASGEVIGLINAGDRYEPEAVETAAKAYRETRCDYFYADIRLLLSGGRTMVKHSRPDRFPTSRHWNHPTSFVTKALYEEIGVFRCEGIHDDFEFYLRARKAGRKMTIVNQVLAEFRTGGASNRKTLAMCRRRVRDLYRGYRENGYSRLYYFECVGKEIVKFLFS